tara:strand:+ start:659 stop:1444 length:786 start_codon:yes stop_codon:yes gene_type:complete
MRVTIFSSNQPRHLNIAREFACIADEVFLISEVNTVFPGKVDDFFRKSTIMQSYFENVIASEKKIFGDLGFNSSKIRQLSIKLGDLNKLNYSQLKEALSSDYYVVFGSSFIKGWLIDFLIKQKALNIHMGLSPYYRGSSCNFWALYDRNPNYVGATIHLLSKGLDSGNILCHCIPKPYKEENLFDFTMKSVKLAHRSLVNLVESETIFSIPSFKQDKSKEIRYSKNQDFNDQVADEFLKRSIPLEFDKFVYPELINPVFGS